MSKSTTLQHALSLLSAVRWIPHTYQKRAVQFLLKHASAGLFLPPGLGKTTIVLKALMLLFKAKVISKVLVVAPLRVCFSTWPGEIQKWTDFNGLRYVVLHNDALKENNCQTREELLAIEADIYIINPEGLDWLLDVKKTVNPRDTKKKIISVDVRKFKKLGFDVLVLDELTKFKNHASDRFKALKMVLPTFGRRWGLTGSPAANGLEQLFGQMFCLDEGRSLGKYITHYRREFFQPAWTGFGWDLQDGAEDRIYERINPVVLRISEKDAGIDMPQLVINDVFVDLPPKAMEVYKAMEDDLIAQLDDGLLVAKNAGVAMGKCRQLANGAIYKTPDVEALVKLPKSMREWAHLHDAKYEALEDILESLQETPALVTYEFEHDFDRLEKLYEGDKFVKKTPMSKFKALEKEWNMGLVPRLFAQSGSISHGLNLQEEGHHIVMIGIPWDYEVYDQLIRRLLRQGNKSKRVFVHRILAKGTVDEDMSATLTRKEKGQNALFAALEFMRSRRGKRRHNKTTSLLRT